MKFSIAQAQSRRHNTNFCCFFLSLKNKSSPRVNVTCQDVGSEWLVGRLYAGITNANTNAKANECWLLSESDLIN